MSQLPVPAPRRLPVPIAIRARVVVRAPLAGWRTLLGLAVGSGGLAVLVTIVAVGGMR